MKKLIIIAFILTLGAMANAAENNAVSFNLKLVQIDSLHKTEHVVYDDTISIISGFTTTGYIGPFSVDIDLLSFDSIKTSFYIHTVSTGPSVSTMSKNFSVEYSLPARIDNLLGKTGNPYKLTLRPIQPVFYDTTNCSFNHREAGTYRSEPTAYTDIYYVTNTYGEFYWDSVKELVETEYRRFKDFALFSLPGKYSIYLCPCDVPTIIWDKRFGTMVDPTRSTTFAIYSKSMNTADPFIISHLAILKNFGYAPSFLSEGLAGYFSFAPFDMKNLITENKNLPLETFLTTSGYLSTDPTISDRTAATFVKYLIDSYGFSKFLKLYQSCDDINLKKQLQIIYNKSIAELNEEWLQFVIDQKIETREFKDFIFQADLMFDYNLIRKYSFGILEYSQTLQDSLAAIAHLKRSFFFTGDYKKAIEYQQQILDNDSSVAVNWLGLGSYNLMAGNFEAAQKYLKKAYAIDSLNSIIRFNKGLGYLCVEDSSAALELFRNNVTQGKGGGEQVQSQIMVALLLNSSDSKTKKEEAKIIFEQTSNSLKQSLQQNSASPSLYLWLGVAEYGRGNYDEVLPLLELAEYLENRPFYQGMIYLWKGKTYLAKNDPIRAKVALEAIKKIKAAAYHRIEADALLKKL